MIRYRILPDHEFMVLCFWGAIDKEEIVAMSERLRSDPGFSRSYDTLVETTHLEHTVSSGEIRDLAEPRVTMGADSRLAIVAPADVTYGTSRMHQILSEHRNHMDTGIFRDRGAALQWLGRGDLDVDSLCDEIVKEE